MTDNRLAADMTRKIFGAPGTTETEKRARLFRTALRLLATGDPITPAQLAAAAEVSVADLEHGAAGEDIEYDDQGRIIGWGLTHNPTPHKLTVNGVELYTWCAPDTLGVPAVIGATAHVESPCPATGSTIRLTVDPDKGVTAVDPAAAVVSIVDPAQVDPHAVRTTGCNLQHFFASADAARDYQSQHPGMTVLPVADAYAQLARPMIEAILGGDPAPGCC
jgi:alkylmercury lyase